MQEEARRGKGGDGDFAEPDALCDERLVVAVGQLAAERRQDEERGDENDAGHRDQYPAVLSRSATCTPEAEQDQHGQRVLQEIVVERRAELAPEQRRELARRHQALEHACLCRERVDRFNLQRIFSRNRGNRMNIVQRHVTLSPLSFTMGRGLG